MWSEEERKPGYEDAMEEKEQNESKGNQMKRNPSMLPEEQARRKKLFQYKELISQPSTSGLEI